MIGLKILFQKNLAFSAVRRCHDNGDEIVAGNGTLPSWSENKLIREDFLNPTQKTGQGIVKGPPATNEEHRKHGRTIDNVTRTATEEPRKPLTPSQTFIEVLRQEAEVIVSILVRGNSEPIDFGASDILELDAPEIILPKTGYVLGMVIVYDWVDILEKDQDGEKEMLPSLAASQGLVGGKPMTLVGVTGKFMESNSGFQN